jgi:hypothetical protein
MIWTERAYAPTALPVSEKALEKLSFSYLRNRANGFEKTLWNCALYKRTAPGQCIKHQPMPGKAPPIAAPVQPGAGTQVAAPGI